MSLADWKEQEKAQRKNAIVDVAEKLFFARDYDDVSMMDVARAVGLNKATLYTYFCDKESLYSAIVLRGCRIQTGLIKERVEASKTGLERLVAIGDACQEFAEKYPDYNRLYTYFRSGRFGVKRAGEAIGKDLEEIYRLGTANFDLMSRCIRQGEEDGTIRPDVDPVEAALVVLILAENAQNLRPEYKLILDERHISHEKFTAGIGEYLKRSIMIEKPSRTGKKN